MQYLNINVERTSPTDSITYLFNEPAFSLPLPLKRTVSALLKQEAEKVADYADLHERLSWELELEHLQAEQARDLASPVMAWWKPKQLTEAEYYEQLAEAHGFEVAA